MLYDDLNLIKLILNGLSKVKLRVQQLWWSLFHPVLTSLMIFDKEFDGATYYVHVSIFFFFG